MTITKLRCRLAVGPWKLTTRAEIEDFLREVYGKHAKIDVVEHDAWPGCAVVIYVDYGVSALARALWYGSTVTDALERGRPVGVERVFIPTFRFWRW